MLTRERFWDNMARRVSGRWIHFRDIPGVNRFTLPDTSHIDKRDKPEFTRRIINELCELGIYTPTLCRPETRSGNPVPPSAATARCQPPIQAVLEFYWNEISSCGPAPFTSPDLESKITTLGNSTRFRQIGNRSGLYQVSLIMTHRDGFPHAYRLGLSARSAWRGDAPASRATRPVYKHRAARKPPSGSMGEAAVPVARANRQWALVGVGRP